MALVAVVALVLGSLGTATAAGLTKAKVKAIATKVVNKKASSLTVANAANATNASSAANATNLGGLPASAYQGTTSTFQITSGTFTSQKNWSFSVPAGTYQFTFDAGLTPAAGKMVLCGFRTNTGSPYFGWDSSYFNGGYVAAWMSGSAVRTYATNQNLSFFCNAEDGNFSVDSNVGITINVTKMTGATSPLAATAAGPAAGPTAGRP